MKFGKNIWNALYFCNSPCQPSKIAKFVKGYIWLYLTGSSNYIAVKDILWTSLCTVTNICQFFLWLPSISFWLFFSLLKCCPFLMHLGSYTLLFPIILQWSAVLEVMYIITTLIHFKGFYYCNWTFELRCWFFWNSLLRQFGFI